MKMYKKSELVMNNGLIITTSGDIILPDVRIVDQANTLETLLQQSAYIADQPEAAPMPSLENFERVSIKDKVEFTASTPTMDQKAEEAMAIMGEIDDMMIVGRANGMLADFAELLDFVSQDFVIDCGDQLYCFDTPMIGSVIKLTRDDIIDIIAKVCGMDESGITKHDTMMAFVPVTDDDINKMDSEGIMNSLSRLAHDVNDLCNDIEAAGDKGNTEE